MKRNMQGITLIALVITIIILLILSSVTIAMLIGENGILRKTQTANTENEKKTATEIMNLKITSAQIESYTQTQEMPTLQYLADKLCEDNDMDYVLKVSKNNKNAKLNPKIQLKEADFLYTKLEEYPYEFKINNSLQLAAIDGVEIADNSTNKVDMVSREEYNTLVKRIEILESQPRNINRVNLMNHSVDIPATTVAKDDDFANMQLSDSIEQYKYLEIQYDLIFEDGNCAEETKFIATNQLNYNNSNTVNWKNESTILFNISYDSGSIVSVVGWFKDNKHFHIGNSYTNHESYKGIKIKSIYGIN